MKSYLAIVFSENKQAYRWTINDSQILSDSLLSGAST